MDINTGNKHDLSDEGRPNSQRYNIRGIKPPAFLIHDLSPGNYINTTGATSGAGTAISLGAPEFIPEF